MAINSFSARGRIYVNGVGTKVHRGAGLVSHRSNHPAGTLATWYYRAWEISWRSTSTYGMGLLVELPVEWIDVFASASCLGM